MEAMQIAGPSFPEKPTTMGMPEGDRLLPPKKRAGLTAPEGALEVPKKAKVEAHTDADGDSDVDSDTNWFQEWLKHWNEFMPKENTESKPWWGVKEEWLPEGVRWSLDTLYDDDYRSLVVYDDCNLYKSKYEGGRFALENEEQRAYLKFYYQLCKEVKLGADYHECKEKALGLTADLCPSLRPLAIRDRMDDLFDELEVKIRHSVYCYLWDEVILKKRDYASVAAEIKEKHSVHATDVMEDASGNCCAKFFLKELEDRIDASIPSEEAHEQIKKACDEEWPKQYSTFASFLEFKVMVAEKLGILPKELQGLLQELHGGAEN